MRQETEKIQQIVAQESSAITEKYEIIKIGDVYKRQGVESIADLLGGNS